MCRNLFTTIFLIDLPNFERRLYFLTNFCRINANNWGSLRFVFCWFLLLISMQLECKFLPIRKIGFNLFSRLHSSIKIRIIQPNINEHQKKVSYAGKTSPTYLVCSIIAIPVNIRNFNLHTELLINDSKNGRNSSYNISGQVIWRIHLPKWFWYIT